MRNPKTANQTSDAPLIPIGAVAQRTGLTPDVLRAWERRYGVVRPVRDADGNRAYREADVQRLKLLKRATNSGFSIGRIAALATDELAGLLKESALPRQSLDKSQSDEEIVEILSAVEAMNGPRVHELLMRSVLSRGADGIVIDVLPTLLHRTGELWEEGTICPAHEHLLSATLQRMLGWIMMQLAVPSDAPVLVTATPSGQRHEMGAMMCGILAASRGWRVVYVGADLPAADIALTVVETRARAVALSVVHQTPADSFMTEMKSLHDEVGTRPVIFVGGREGWRHRKALAAIGLKPLNSLGEFAQQLQRAR